MGPKRPFLCVVAALAILVAADANAHVLVHVPHVRADTSLPTSSPRTLEPVSVPHGVPQVLAPDSVSIDPPTGVLQAPDTDVARTPPVPLRRVLPPVPTAGHASTVTFADTAVALDLPHPSIQADSSALAARKVAGDMVLGPAAARDMLLTLAYSLRGIPYRWGGQAPDKGFDCSGLVRYVFRKALHIDLPRRSSRQAGSGEHIKRDDLAPGDLVFFHTEGRGISHVGIYLDDGRFLHAPRTGETIRVDKLGNPYWTRHYVGARRVEALAHS